jgi:hypothetical protein
MEVSLVTSSSGPEEITTDLYLRHREQGVHSSHPRACRIQRKKSLGNCALKKGGVNKTWQEIQLER